MANNDLSIRFTEEVYATKAELARELRITNVDSFWVNVLSYRNQFARSLKLQSIEHKSFGLCFCQSISALLSNIDNKLVRLNRNYSLLFRNQSSLDNFNNLLKDRILKTSHSCAQYTTLLNFAYSNFENLPNQFLLPNILIRLPFLFFQSLFCSSNTNPSELMHPYILQIRRKNADINM